MFGFFKNRKAKLQKEYEKLLAESYRLSHVDRKQSDLKAAEADRLRQMIDSIDAGEQTLRRS